MNCEMAQRTIALAALAPALTHHEGSPDREARFSRTSHPAPFETHATPADKGSHVRLVPDLLEPDFLNPGVDENPAFAGPEHVFDPTAFGDGELAEEERAALEEHLAGCRTCQAEMAATAAFYSALSLTRQPEPTPSLLARARLRLDATLDSHAHQSVVAHLLQQLSFSAGRLRASPGLASGLLMLGLVVGGYGGYRAGHAVHNREQGVLVMERPPAISDVSSIARDPDSEQVVIHYNRLEPDTFSGSLDDPAIRRLLMLAMQNGADPVVQTNSFHLLASECRNGHACGGGPIRDALLHVLHTDRKPQVRLEALDGLEPYIAEDMEVRDAVVRAMMADTSASVRIEAIRLLTPVEVDSSVRQALHTVAVRDGDPTIRSASQQLLNGMPQLQ